VAGTILLFGGMFPHFAVLGAGCFYYTYSNAAAMQKKGPAQSPVEPIELSSFQLIAANGVAQQLWSLRLDREGRAKPQTGNDGLLD